jgi:hypothetical protein
MVVGVLGVQGKVGDSCLEIKVNENNVSMEH